MTQIVGAKVIGKVLKQGSGRSPNLRAARVPLSLLHFLRAHDQPQSEWLNAISSDQTLSEAVRQRALQFAREWK